MTTWAAGQRMKKTGELTARTTFSRESFMAHPSHIERRKRACWRIFAFSLASAVIFEGATHGARGPHRRDENA